MQKFDVLRAVAAPFPFVNVDTDRIIRVERCVRTPRDEMGRWAFELERFTPEGAERESFVLNRAPFRGAGILVAGDNFGCGSSREMAVWAIAGLGIRCVIAPSFGEIFFGNCFENGVLPVRLPAPLVQDLQSRLAGCHHAEGATLTVDLRQQEIRTPWGGPLRFAVEPLRREALLQGLDAIGATLRRSAAIDSFQQRQRAALPWIWRA
jgi:3-isopropylmalate/(R)-2-methylmalate dehydratase small subunit